MRWMLSLLIASICGVPVVATERRPNLIFLYADDLGWGDVGFNGRTDWKTPNLDRLGAQGTVFKRWYTAAPLCAPSRAALMTGKYGIHNGVTANNDELPPDTVTLAQALQKRGYKTALFGKWHHGRPRPGMKEYLNPLDRGFDEFMGFTDAGHAWEQYPKELWFGREKKPVNGYSNTMFTDRAVDFIRRQKDKPFFLYVPYIATHFHIQAPPEDVKEHLGKFKEKDAKNPVNATYAAMVTRLDKEIGRILKTLEELNLTGDTMIVFSSDHGATFESGNKGASAYHDSNRPFRGQKRTLWEGGIRVPGLVRWPSHVPSGKISQDIVHMTDVYPTFLAAAGVKLEASCKVDGINQLPVWEGKEKAPDRTLFWEWRTEGSRQLAAMRGNLKMVITADNGPELFDLAADPGERRSVIAEHPETAKQMRKELNDWLKTETDEAKWGKKPPRRN